MKKPLRILLVEDNAGDACLLREALSTEAPGSFVLTHVRRMNEAVVKLADGDLDVVMLDLGLPDAHGLESVRRVVAARAKRRSYCIDRFGGRCFCSQRNQGRCTGLSD